MLQDISKVGALHFLLSVFALEEHEKVFALNIDIYLLSWVRQAIGRNVS